MHIHRLTLDVTDRADVLPRIVGLCHRRGCEIISLSYERGDRHRPGRLDLAVRADDRHLRPLAPKLAALVDVQDVRAA
jgi:acetolactate synthase small subunit